MIIVHDEKSLNKKSIKAMDELTRDKDVAPIEVLRFWREWGILIPPRKTIEKLKLKFNL